MEPWESPAELTKAMIMSIVIKIALFALALTAVNQADAQDGRRGRRSTTVVVAPRAVRTAPVQRDRHPGFHHGSGAYRVPSRSAVAARRELFDERRDHAAVVDLAARWRNAAVRRNPHAQRQLERQLTAWIHREIFESSRMGHDMRYAHRLRVLRRDLAAPHRGRGYAAGRHRSETYKARVIREIVVLSGRQLRRAELRLREQMHFAFAYR